MDTLHIYGQDHWHDDAWITGNKSGLKALRDAIDKALMEGKSSCAVYVIDGEGYVTLVICTEEELAVPYTAEEAREKDVVKWPWHLLNKEEYKRLTNI